MTARRLGTMLAAAAVLAVALGRGAGAAPPVVQRLDGTLRTADHPAPQHLDVIRMDGVDYVDLRLVARLFHGTKYWRAELEKMVLKVNGRRVRLTVGSPYVFVDDRGVNLMAPVRWHQGRIVVPVRLATDVLDDLVGETAKWDRRTRALTIGTGDPNVMALTFDVRQNGTLVEVRLAERLDGRLEHPRPGRVVLVIPQGVLDESMLEGFDGTGLVDSVETRQDPGAAVLTLHLGLLGGTAELIPRSSPPRLVVAVSENAPDDVPLPGFERTDKRPAGREIRTVVIDPGHGGSDTGIVTGDGTPEKDLTLALARKLRDRLHDEDGGLQVVLTREDDRFLSNEERAARANAEHADVFVSLHGNGWFDGSVRGFTVGMYGGQAAQPPSEFARWGEPDPAVVADTEALAEALLESMGSLLGLPSRGVHTAAYAVLAGATMPAVQVECAFLTNAEDAREMQRADFRESVAIALARGIHEYALGRGESP